MIRPITSSATSEPLSRAGLLALRPAEGNGERASNDSVEQQGIAVQQVAVIALGGGLQGPLTSDSIAPELTAHGQAAPLPQPRPSSPPSSASAESLTEAAIRAELAAPDASVSESGADGPRLAGVAGASADSSSLSFEDMAAQIAAKTFITHTSRPLQGDPEATLQKLLRMRDDALAPPASVADLAIATAAAIRIGRLVRDRYAAEQAAAAGPSPESRPTLPPMKA